MLALLKSLLAVMIIFVFVGCVNQPIIIPDMPVFEEMQAYRFNHFVCFDVENEAALRRNTLKLKNYADKLREILENRKRGN